ncbi:hypothetical protein B5S31_g2852 [[Candida] boidinii]|nr:hypothetical protein B5S31_g2852 [[Candida] boidinii]
MEEFEFSVNYTDFHKTVLQYMMQVKVATQPQLLDLSKNVYSAIMRHQRIQQLSQENNADENGEDTSNEVTNGNVNQDESPQNGTNAENSGDSSTGKEITLSDEDESSIKEAIDSLTNNTVEFTVVALNRKLNTVDFEIVRTSSQESEEILYILINKKSDNAVKLSTIFTNAEIQIINDLIDRMFDHSNESKSSLSYSISPAVAVEFVKKSSSKTTNQQSYEFLNDLELKGWISYIDRRYTLSSRALAELKGFLIDKYGEDSAETEGSISICYGCKQIATRGLRCSNDSCFIRFHSLCRDHFIKSNSDSTKCPNNDCDLRIGENDMGIYF